MSRIGRHAWSRFLAVATPLFRSEARWRALSLLGLLVGLVFALTALNAAISYVFHRQFMTSIEKRSFDDFRLYGLLSLGVFALLTVAGAFKTFTEQRFGLLWRDWLTRHLTDRYLAGHAYYRIKESGALDNPDQRIAEDARSFTETTLSFLLILLNAALTLVTFSGILWSITPWLLLAAVGYAALGSLLTLVLGRRLVGLNVLRLQQEADLRYELIRVRENAEAVALLRGERQEKARVRGRLEVLVENMKVIIGVNLNLGFFSIGFSNLIPVIPVLIVAPLYIAGRAEFGAITQAMMLFAHVLGAFSLIVTEFQRISAFAADNERLGAMWEAIDAAERPAASGIVLEDGGRLAYEGLTLKAPKDGRPLVEGLELGLAPGERLLVVGPNGGGRSALARATAGLWRSGEGGVVRPPLDEVRFLPQKPFLTPGTLREQLLYGAGTDKVPDSRLLEVIEEVGLGAVLERAGGLDVVQDWPNLLSLGDQQVVSFARLIVAGPRLAFLDESTSALDESRARRLYEALARTPIGYVSLAGDLSLREYHDRLLELDGEGGWRLGPSAPAPAAPEPILRLLRPDPEPQEAEVAVEEPVRVAVQ
jgi:vitamin B12/bleomycin/antimicrobial peptide transport system ATP-binding/permease protein